jgi:hypothetical protein
VSNGGHVSNTTWLKIRKDKVPFDAEKIKIKIKIKIKNKFINNHQTQNVIGYVKGVQSIFIYTRGKELIEYHTINDTSENFPFTAYDGLFALLTGLVQDN